MSTNDPRMRPSSEQLDGLIESLETNDAVDSDEFRVLMEHMPIALAISRAAGGTQRIVYANKVCEALCGRSCAEVIGKDWSILDSFVQEAEPHACFSTVVATSDDFVGVFKCEKPQFQLVEVYSAVIENDEAGKSYRIIALIDVSEREKSQREEFERRLRDKDLLLKELQHRVKNNLQLITALIRLDARNHRNGDKVNLDRLAGRIEALQLLYRDLTADGLGQSVELGHYVSQIATAVMHTYAVDGIRLDLKVDHGPASINVAMPVGLLVNELLTNAFKYAFTGRSSGTITVRCLRESDERFRVVVADDGIGLAEGATWPAQGKLGTLILQTLRENATTDFQVESSPGIGLRVTINFVHKGPVQVLN